MKKTYYLFITLLIYLQTFGQIYTGDLTLTNQAEVNNFRYTEVDGTLTIEESSSGEISNLSNLITLKKVRAKLSINNNSNLSSLDGLNNLEEVLGSLIIKNNSSLTTISALSSLTKILFDEGVFGGDLLIENNDELVSLEGLENLQWIPGDLNIIGNDGLITITSLGNTLIDKNGIIASSSSLTTIDGLKMAAITLTFRDNPLLSNISNINGETINLIIDNNDSLINLRGFESLATGFQFLGIDTGYSISNNDNLLSFEGLPNRLTTGSVIIENNPKLTNIDVLKDLKKGSVVIENNKSLTNINALENFQEGTVIIINNDLLVSLSPLSNYTGGTELTIEGNVLLTNLSGLESVNELGKLKIKNTQLNSINQLSTIVNCNVLIENNPYINSLDIFSNDFSIGPCGFRGDIGIINNPKLTNLTGFENVEKLLGRLKILQNENLVDFCSISRMINNEDSRLDYQVQNNQHNPQIMDFSNKNCSTLDIENYNLNEVTLYPNPTRGMILIKGNVEITKVETYNLQGQKISSYVNKKEIDISNLSNGMYLLKVTASDDKTQTIKFIKE